MPETNNPHKPQPDFQEPRKISELFDEFGVAVRNWFRELTNLDEGVDREGTIIAIRKNRRIRGANAWLLICSIMIASLGLSLNSPAVIIGAMLISPLMSPILGVGLGIAINDREMLTISMQHFVVAIAIALVVSFLFFSIPVVNGVTNEIESRTQPTLLDGLVAIFGGLAGIISITRKEKGSALPGVAIATALMPPLCVSGFGLATRDWSIALNAFYLFFLNSFFIAVTAYLVIRFLRFPMRSYMDEFEARRVRAGLTFFSILITIPSVIILFNTIQKKAEEQKIADFVAYYFQGPDKDPTCIEYRIMGDTARELVLQLVGKNIDEDSIQVYRQHLDSIGFPDLELSLQQGAEVSLVDLREVESSIRNMDNLLNNMEEASRINRERLKTYDELIASDSLRFFLPSTDRMSPLIAAAFPDLERLGFARVMETDLKSSGQEMPYLLVKWSRRLGPQAMRREEVKLYKFVKTSTELDTLVILRYNP